ncbi:46159_t:CDS:1, partial [Gigaspora margarita]
MRQHFISTFILLIALSVAIAAPLKRSTTFEKCTKFKIVPDLLNVKINPDPLLPNKAFTVSTSGTVTTTVTDGNVEVSVDGLTVASDFDDASFKAKANQTFKTNKQPLNPIPNNTTFALSVVATDDDGNII